MFVGMAFFLIITTFVPEPDLAGEASEVCRHKLGVPHNSSCETFACVHSPGLRNKEQSPPYDDWCHCCDWHQVCRGGDIVCATVAL